MMSREDKMKLSLAKTYAELAETSPEKARLILEYMQKRLETAEKGKKAKPSSK